MSRAYPKRSEDVFCVCMRASLPERTGYVQSMFKTLFFSKVTFFDLFRYSKKLDVVKSFFLLMAIRDHLAVERACRRSLGLGDA